MAIFAKGKKGARGQYMGASFSLFRKTLFCGNFATFFLWGAIWPSFFYVISKKKLKRLNVEITKVRTSIPQVQFFSAEILDICNSKKKEKFLIVFWGRKKSSTDIQSPIFFSFVSRYTFSSNHNIHKSFCGLCFWASDP